MSFIKRLRNKHKSSIGKNNTVIVADYKNAIVKIKGTGNPAKIVKRNVAWEAADNGDYCNNNFKQEY